jgi:RNA polymerase sigma factor (sigma-70 family)
MDEHDRLAERFQAHRAHLSAVAVRILGARGDADDAVQETWLRLRRSDVSGVDNLVGWLTTVVSRICLDMLRTRASRREVPVGHQHAGGGQHEGPEHEVVLVDSVGQALAVVLDTLSPAERVAFVLHDVFGVPFEEIAPVVERSPAAARQLASRARRRVRNEAPEPDADVAVQRRAVDAFLAAARDGDFEGLLRVLDPDVVLRVDGGPNAPKAFARAPIAGAEEVARSASGFRGGADRAEPVTVNGQAGLLVRFPALKILAAFTVAGGRIVEIDIIADQAKLRGLDRP